MSLMLMGKKKGMTRLFDESGKSMACTVIMVEPNVVVQVKTKEKDGYSALQLGACKVSEPKKKNVSKPLKGHFALAKVEPRKHLLEARSEEATSFEVGSEIGLEYFSDCAYVDVAGISKGKGYQGVMKRHGFRGGPGAHGSGFHRHAGSTGMRSTPGRCLPGVRMAGQMGTERVTVENLRVMQVDIEKQIILVKGAIPGTREALVFIRKSHKKAK
jgi:large subunit ribosomal protein L3